MTSGPRPAPPIRLAFAALFWRLMGGFMLLLSLLVILFLARRPMPAGHRVFFFLFIMGSWSAIVFSLSSLLTLMVQLTVAFIVRPRVLSWQAPAVDESHSPFHLEPRERVEIESSARMAMGRSWPAGRLVLTDRRILFLPAAWDVEMWSIPRARIRRAGAVESPPMLWGLIRNVPARLEVEVEADDRESRLFALPEARAWESGALAPLHVGTHAARSL